MRLSLRPSVADGPRGKPLRASLITAACALTWLVLGGSSAWTAAPEQPATVTASAPNVSPAATENVPFINSDVKSDRSAGKNSGWFKNPAATIEDIFTVYEAGRAFAREAYESLGEAEFNKALDTRKIALELEKGRVEFTGIDGVPIARVLHEPTGTAYLFIDAELIQADSPHLLQYISRLHTQSGYTRKDGLKGRDVVLVWMQDDRVTNVELQEKPRLLSRRYWREYWRAIYKKPTLDNVVFGVGCGILQTIFGLAVSAAKVYIDPSAEFLMEPALLNFLFGTAIGSFSSTYRNWVLNGDPKTTVLRSGMISAIYAYTLTFSSQAGLQSVTFMDTAGVLTNAKIWSNILANNWAKIEWTQWAKIKATERADSGVYTVPLPYLKLERDADGEKTARSLRLKKYDFKVTERDINHQIYAYLPPQFLRTADLIGMTLSLPVLGIAIPIGSIALWSSIPIVKYATLKWAEKNHPKSAAELKMREDWEKFRRLPLTFPVRVYKAGRDLIWNLWNQRGAQAPLRPEGLSTAQYKAALQEYNRSVVNELKYRCQSLF